MQRQRHRVPLALLVLLMLCIRGLWSKKAVLVAVPSAIRPGENVALQCVYDLEGESLYTVKWYFRNDEFYRFVTSEPQKQRFFAGNGIVVDMSMSNDTQVMLRKLNFTMAGDYMCEVSADAPTFWTAKAYTRIRIMQPPSTPPIVTTERDKYVAGDELVGKCTTPLSRPETNLTFFINSQMLPLAESRVINLEDNMVTTELVAKVTLQASHFRNGRMVLRCVAVMHPLYAESASKSFSIKLVSKPERITLMSTPPRSAAIAHRATFIIFLMALLLSLVSSEYDDYFYDYTIENSNAGWSKKLQDQLLG